MKRSLAALIVVMISPLASSVETLSGLWQHESGTAVYVDVSSGGQVFQCRIAQDGSVIRAFGELQGDSSISWQPISINDVNGNSLDSEGFSWGVDGISLSSNNLTLKGVYGDFVYTRCATEMPKSCR